MSKIDQKVAEYKQNNNYRSIPPRIIAGLMRYKYQGVIPGSFLQSVIKDKFTDTVGRADPVTIQHLKKIAMFMANEMPYDSWGSEEKMFNWAKKKAEETQ